MRAKAKRNKTMTDVFLISTLAGAGQSLANVKVTESLGLNDAKVNLGTTNVDFSGSNIDITNAALLFGMGSTTSGLSTATNFIDMTLEGDTNVKDFTTNDSNVLMNDKHIDITNTELDFSGATIINFNRQSAVNNAKLSGRTIFAPGSELIIGATADSDFSDAAMLFEGAKFNDSIFASSPAILDVENTLFTAQHSFTGFFSERGLFAFNTWENDPSSNARMLQSNFRWTKMGRLVTLSTPTVMYPTGRESHERDDSTEKTGKIEPTIWNTMVNYDTASVWDDSSKSVLNPSIWPDASWEPINSTTVPSGQVLRVGCPLTIAINGGYERGELYLSRTKAGVNNMSIRRTLDNPEGFIAPGLDVVGSEKSWYINENGGNPAMGGWYATSMQYVTNM